MFKKIVIPLDSSIFAEQVLTAIPAISDPTTTELVFVSLVSLNMIAHSPNLMGTNELMIPALTKRFEVYLNEKASQWRQRGYRVSSEIAVGEAATSLVQIADELHADLIAMCTHGHTGIKRAVLGSVADRVAQSTTLPLFLVQPNTQPLADLHIRTILVPLDGSPLAEKVLPLAKKVALAKGASLLLLRVIPPAAVHERELYFADATTKARSEQATSNLAQHYLERLQLRLRHEGVPTSIKVLLGSSAQTILEVAAGESIDLITICTHGRSGVNRWVYGSVAGQVLHGARCPLLLVRGYERVEHSAESPSHLARVNATHLAL